jgi:hypothetical protein
MITRTGPISLRVLVLLFLLALPGFNRAQDLPDPGRRLSREEQEADPEKRAAEKPHAADARPAVRARDAQACKNARIYYQISCGAPGSQREYGRTCAEAYALYRQSCP